MEHTALPDKGFAELGSQVAYSQQGFQSKIVFEMPGAKAIVFAFEQGQQLKEHKTAHDVLLVMLEGECVFTIYQEEVPLKAGELYRIPAHEPHALQAVSNFKMLLIK